MENCKRGEIMWKRFQKLWIKFGKEIKYHNFPQLRIFFIKDSSTLELNAKELQYITIISPWLLIFKIDGLSSLVALYQIKVS